MSFKTTCKNCGGCGDTDVYGIMQAWGGIPMVHRDPEICRKNRFQSRFNEVKSYLNTKKL